jgi:hypothetical protein
MANQHTVAADTSKFVIGPATNISITLEMLGLLARVAGFALARPSLVPLTCEEQHAVEAFNTQVAETVKWEKENPGRQMTHGFCL